MKEQLAIAAMDVLIASIDRMTAQAQRIADALESGPHGPSALQQAVDDTRRDQYRRLVGHVTYWRTKHRREFSEIHEESLAQAMAELKEFKRQYPEIVTRKAGN